MNEKNCFLDLANALTSKVLSWWPKIKQFFLCKFGRFTSITLKKNAAKNVLSYEYCNKAMFGSGPIFVFPGIFKFDKKLMNKDMSS